ncbi:VOC family protein [Streptomyces sp. MST-110588]|uniref:VOC family protein n=1 Tax=Streptomyces sp. MST-110588 TaxID=2833628 RepID=UPI001F5C0D79|nr:VOC family protein [Streptomyces sp. MST-110588]UNO43039.1 VOC family protein [Streptomyces sp. MST-110588]
MGLVKAAVVVLDCSAPEKLADFYRELLDGEERPGAGADRVEVVGRTGIHMAFRRDLNATPPSWPRPDSSQQIHLDLLVTEEDMDALERKVVGLGARPMDTKDDTGPREVRLYADPAGHTFSLRCSLASGPKTG